MQIKIIKNQILIALRNLDKMGLYSDTCFGMDPMARTVDWGGIEAPSLSW
jgi:hypothetical protein